VRSNQVINKRGAEGKKGRKRPRRSQPKKIKTTLLNGGNSPKKPKSSGGKSAQFSTPSSEGSRGDRSKNQIVKQNLEGQAAPKHAIAKWEEIWGEEGGKRATGKRKTPLESTQRKKRRKNSLYVPTQRGGAHAPTNNDRGQKMSASWLVKVGT